jgi:hypothetical protein
MSSRATNAGVAVVAVALAAGGVFFGVRGADDSGGSSPDSVPIATNPSVTVSPPSPAAVETIPAVTVADGSADDGLLPVPNVLGVPENVARSRLDAFDVVVSRVPTTIPDEFDEVTSQDPAAASRLKPGGTVDIVLSERPAPDTIEVEPFPAGEFDLVDLDALEPGECGTRRLAERTLLFDPVECAMAHDLEMIARFELEDAPETYDDDVVSRLVREECARVFEEYVGLEPADSDLISYSIRPSPDVYAEGERTSECAVRSKDGVQILGSAQGTYW